MFLQPASQQPPELPVLSRVDCFSQCELVGLKLISDSLHDVNGGRLGGLFRSSSGGCSYELLNDSTVIHSHDVPKHRKMPRLYCRSDKQLLR